MNLDDTEVAPSQEALLDLACDRFENEWKTGGRPEIEIYLHDIVEKSRVGLLRELLRIEFAYLIKAKDTISLDAYRERFRPWQVSVDEIFDEAFRTQDRPKEPALGEAAEAVAPFPGDGEAARTAGDYELLEEVGRGGMGVVYRARDVRLGRDVAVKLMSDRIPLGSSSARRFMEEARITGRLQHPGIPAVHRAGVTEGGRPFLAMKLIKGRTLDALLRAAPRPASGWRTLLNSETRAGAGSTHTGRPASPDRARLIGSFEQVCQAVGYAHAHGVIHRDLKPSNVMIGAFGEVQVMDWGLAKLLSDRLGSDPTPAERETTENSAHNSARDSDLATEQGSLLGTPAFMPPEQAAGEVDAIDARSDVFGLGGILCVILTGKPPYVGSDAESTRQLAAQALLDDAHARLDGCGAEPSLVSLCKQCLSAEKADRPANAGVVAETIANLRAAAENRAKSAELAAAEAAVRAVEAGKRRRVRHMLIAALAAGLIGTTGFGLWAKSEADRATTQKRATDSALKQVLAEQKESRAARQRTLTALRTMTEDAVRERALGQSSVSPTDRLYLQRVQTLWMEFADSRGDTEEARAAVAEGLFRVSQIRSQLGDTANAERGYRLALSNFQKLDHDFPAGTQYRVSVGETLTSMGKLFLVLDRLPEAERALREALPYREKAVAEAKDEPECREDLARTLSSLGIVLDALGRSAEAEEIDQTALAIQEKLVREFPGNPLYRHGLATTHNNLGVLHASARRTLEAESEYRAALSIREPLLQQFPNDALYRSDLAKVYNNLANFMSNNKRPVEAEQAYRSAIKLREKLVADFPANSEERFAMSGTLTNLANLLGGIDRRSEALQIQQAAIVHQEKLVIDFPNEPKHQIALGGCYCNLGNRMSDGPTPADALSWYDKAITTLTPLLGRPPANPPAILFTRNARTPSAKLFLRNSLVGRAVTLAGLGRYADAIPDWDKLIELDDGQEQNFFRAKRAAALIHVGRVAEAVEEVAELSRTGGWKPGQWYDFACVYAVAGKEIADKRESYASLSVQMLRNAIGAGFRDRSRIARDVLLDPLRSRSDFQKLVAGSMK